MDSEITRACDADRDRYAQHLPLLHARGFITVEEWDAKLDAVYASTTRTDLDAVMAGLPRPRAAPGHRRDWGLPVRFVPACTLGGIAGLLVAALPGVALAHQHGAVAAVVAIAALIIGVVITISSLILLVTAGICWSDEQHKKARVERDRRGW